ncbi:hypothetical protein [Streptomyces sp. CoH17]|uniref:hypothetical protein n=1 Tax=Streptomyces sp. CoH17 TaxID=2992806 RepID=UPI00226DA329|nr:hypothetical protein [Streptomyces sp. CoH17]
MKVLDSVERILLRKALLCIDTINTRLVRRGFAVQFAVVFEDLTDGSLRKCGDEPEIEHRRPAERSSGERTRPRIGQPSEGQSSRTVVV